MKRLTTLGGGNAAAACPMSSGAAVAIVSPRHVHLPDIPLDNSVIFELIVFIYSALVLGLQYINLYKTVWWLPHSSAHYGLVRCVFHSVVIVISLPENDSFRKDLCFTHDVFFYSTRDLRDAWADRLEILHDGQY